jgi:hypothetical protein
MPSIVLRAARPSHRRRCASSGGSWSAAPLEYPVRCRFTRPRAASTTGRPHPKVASRGIDSNNVSWPPALHRPLLRRQPGQECRGHGERHGLASVVHQRRHKADDTLWHQLRCLGEAMARTERGVGTLVEAPAQLKKRSLLLHTCDGRRRDARLGQLGAEVPRRRRLQPVLFGPKVVCHAAISRLHIRPETR